MRLYVLVREDLSHSQRAVQAVHAVSEYFTSPGQGQWRNGPLVILGVRDEATLRGLKDLLAETGA